IAWATVIKSNLLSGNAVSSAFSTEYEILFFFVAFVICAALISVAYTSLKYLDKVMASCPLPVPQSHADFFTGNKGSRNSNNCLGYPGRNLEYRSDCFEKLSFINAKMIHRKKTERINNL